MFAWVVQRLQAAGLARGRTVGVDATTLAAGAALRRLQRKDSGEDCDEFVQRLAEASGLETPTREELLDFDRQRQPKTLSNAEWEHPADPDARVARMKDGATDMACKAEHCVDLESGALVGVTVQAADLGDTTTLAAAAEALGAAPETVVADKGYHSGATVQRLAGDGLRAVIPEPRRPERKWQAGQEAERAAVEARPGAGGQRRGPAAGTVAGGTGGAVDGSHVRDGRAAAGVPAGAQQHSEATAGTCERLQSGRADAVADGDRYASQPARAPSGSRFRAGTARKRASGGPEMASERPQEPAAAISAVVAPGGRAACSLTHGRCLFSRPAKTRLNQQAPSEHAFENEARHGIGEPHRRGTQRLVAL